MRSEVWRFYSKPAGLDLYSRERGLWQAKIIFAIVFYFLHCTNAFLFLFIFIFKIICFITYKIYIFFYNRGEYAAGNKTYHWKGKGKGLGKTE